MTDMRTPEQQVPHQTVIVQPTPANQSNGVGIAGFILAILSLFLGWIPIVGWVMWLLGLVLSFIGVFKVPRGFAIAGLVISLIGLILLIVIFGALVSFGSLAH